MSSVDLIIFLFIDIVDFHYAGSTILFKYIYGILLKLMKIYLQREGSRAERTKVAIDLSKMEKNTKFDLIKTN